MQIKNRNANHSRQAGSAFHNESFSKFTSWARISWQRTTNPRSCYAEHSMLTQYWVSTTQPCLALSLLASWCVPEVPRETQILDLNGIFYEFLNYDLIWMQSGQDEQTNRQ